MRMTSPQTRSHLSENPGQLARYHPLNFVSFPPILPYPSLSGGSPHQTRTRKFTIPLPPSSRTTLRPSASSLPGLTRPRRVTCRTRCSFHSLSLLAMRCTKWPASLAISSHIYFFYHCATVAHLVFVCFSLRHALAGLLCICTFVLDREPPLPVIRIRRVDCETEMACNSL